MPQIITTSTYDVNYIATTGGTLSILIQDISSQYQIYGTLTPSGNLLINADTSVVSPSNGTTYTFEYTANVTLTGSNTFTIFGYSLTPAQALTYGKIISTWDSINSVWHTQYFPDFSRGTGFILPSQISGTTAGNGLTSTAGVLSVNVDNTTIQITGNALKVKDDSITNAKLAIGATNSAKAVNNSGAVTDIAIPTGTMLGNTGSGIAAIPLSSAVSGTYDSISAYVSFEAGEQFYSYVYLPYDCTIIAAFYTVTKTLSGTDAGVINISDYNNTTVFNSISIPASTVGGTTNTYIWSPAHTFFVGTLNTSVIGFQGAKTTVGGKAQITLLIQRN